MCVIGLEAGNRLASTQPSKTGCHAAVARLTIGLTFEQNGPQPCSSPPLHQPMHNPTITLPHLPSLYQISSRKQITDHFRLESSSNSLQSPVSSLFQTPSPTPDCLTTKCPPSLSQTTNSGDAPSAKQQQHPKKMEAALIALRDANPPSSSLSEEWGKGTPVQQWRGLKIDEEDGSLQELCVRLVLLLLSSSHALPCARPSACVCQHC